MTKLHQGQNQRNSTVEDAELISALQDIASAVDVSDACQAIARYASSLNGELLCMKICDKNNEAQTQPIFSAYPDSVAQVIAELRIRGGCPFLKEAKRLLRPLDSCTIDKSKYTSFLERRFFKEISKIGHEHIAVLPVMIGRGVVIALVGFYNKPFTGQLHQQVCGAFPHFVAACTSRFPEIKTLFEQKVLTESERNIVQMLCDGLTPSDIGDKIGLSTITVDQIISHTGDKLGAANRTQLGYRALVMGEISHPRIRSSLT